LDMGSDIKGEPNKNALSKEVQEAIEICADYIKYNQLSADTKANMAVMLEGIQLEIEEIVQEERLIDKKWADGLHYSEKIIQQKIDKLKENEK